MGDSNKNTYLAAVRTSELPAVITSAGDRATTLFLQYFTAEIRNPHTREAYARAITRFFNWSEQMGLTLDEIKPMVVALYIEELLTEVGTSTVKLHLAAIRKVFDYLVIGGVLENNPAASVRGPKYNPTVGLTPVLSADEARRLIDAIPIRDRMGRPLVIGLRDRAMIGVMVYSFARVSAVVGMDRDDFFVNGGQQTLRLHEKGSKVLEIPAHPNAALYLEEYLEVAGLTKGPLFPSANRHRLLNPTRIGRGPVLRMVKRHAARAGLSPKVCCHTFRATGITEFLNQGGALERAQKFAGHSSPTTTQLYDRRDAEDDLDEIGRIRI